jgi:hypothetical protein
MRCRSLQDDLLVPYTRPISKPVACRIFHPPPAPASRFMLFITSVVPFSAGLRWLLRGSGDGAHPTSIHWPPGAARTITAANTTTKEIRLKIGNGSAWMGKLGASMPFMSRLHAFPARRGLLPVEPQKQRVYPLRSYVDGTCHRMRFSTAEALTCTCEALKSQNHIFSHSTWQVSLAAVSS